MVKTGNRARSCMQGRRKLYPMTSIHPPGSDFVLALPSFEQEEVFGELDVMIGPSQGGTIHIKFYEVPRTIEKTAEGLDAETRRRAKVGDYGDYGSL